MPSGTRKIVHLSDLHLGYGDLADRFACIVSRLAFLKEPASDYVVVISGDLVEDAFEMSDFAIARAAVDGLREHGFHVVVCPGNHDYGSGALGSKRFVDAFRRAFFPDPAFEWPRVDLIDDVACITLDSMAEELHWHDTLFAQGELGSAQLARLDDRLGSDPVRHAGHRVLAMHHHPFDHRPFAELKDSSALREVLSGHARVDAILYGHNHEGKIHNGKWHVARCYDAGSTTRKLGAPGPHRVIDLHRTAREDYDGDFHCGDGLGALVAGS